MADSYRPQLVWITGAGKGIGRALARRLAEDGWLVAASARTEDDLLTLAQECPPGRVHAYPLDIADGVRAEDTFARIETQLGLPDLVVLNAGTHIPVTVDDFSVDSFRQLMETNLMGTVHTLAPAISKFVARGRGHIAVVASLAGYRGLPTSAAYGATKAGLINMCEALKPELEQRGVRLTLVNPGFVETPLTDRNEFPMPFLIPVDAAVERLVRGLGSGAFEITFPWRFAAMMKLLRVIPDRLFFAVTRRMVRR